MKKLVNFDPLIIVLLEKESQKYRTSTSAIIRAAVLDWICRTYNTIPPPMFKNEKTLLEMRGIQEYYARICREEEKHPNEHILNAQDPQEIFETIINELFEMSRAERHTLYLKTQPN